MPESDRAPGSSDETSSLRHVLIQGSGALGSLYGALLQRGGLKVTVQARADYKTIREFGIRIESLAGLGDWIFWPDEILPEGERPAKAPDLILMAVKVTPEVPRVQMLSNLLKEEKTPILILSNGVGVEEDIKQAFPKNPLLGAVAFVCATRVKSGHVQHHAYGHLVLGAYPEGPSFWAEKLAEHLIEGGGSAETTTAIRGLRWQKNLWNAAFNAITVLSGGHDTSVVLGCEEELVRSVMAEVHQVAASDGYLIPWTVIEKQIEGTHRMPAYAPSMLLDDRAGRPLEIEAILGNVIRTGRRNGIPTPRLDTLYALLKFRALRSL